MHAGEEIVSYESPRPSAGIHRIVFALFRQERRQSEEVVGYEGPRPVMGIHRIVFILFRQLGRQTVYAPGWRQNFNTRDFSELYNLGSPVAATFFNCKRQLDSIRRR
ncbi:Protein FLOWERING LOCUS T [Vigna unguiculata]|uniref:Protein FLOWERING LOCUS T n=1 Tax=Vigna unguiculata TaxID=3917 RepID=A0A4D6NGU3_VIGUN|nr:Protein FLOWERING LOCUS T [Vigna unguiculata]